MTVGKRALSPQQDLAGIPLAKHALETGQPLHVFDYDKLRGGIIVRRAAGGERLLCLDGRTRELSPGMLVIADQEGPVALAGIIGARRS